jgi:hypothetical protein
MADKNSNRTEEQTGREDLSRDDPAPNLEGNDEGSVKGGADGKAKALGGKGLGDYVKTDKSERVGE